MARKLRARRTGYCATCGEPIAVGELIEWDVTEGATHADKRECAAVDEAFERMLAEVTPPYVLY